MGANKDSSKAVEANKSHKSLYLLAAEFIGREEGFIPMAVFDVDKYRIGHGSDTITIDEGHFRPVQKGDVTTLEMADLDLARRLKDFEAGLKAQIGEENWKRIPVNAKVALMSLAYNYGSITKTEIKEAAKGGNPVDISNAILSSTKNDNERLLHIDNDRNKPFKTGDALQKAQKLRDALYARRKREAAYAIK